MKICIPIFVRILRRVEGSLNPELRFPCHSKHNEHSISLVPFRLNKNTLVKATSKAVNKFCLLQTESLQRWLQSKRCLLSDSILRPAVSLVWVWSFHFCVITLWRPVAFYSFLFPTRGLLVCLIRNPEVINTKWEHAAEQLMFRVFSSQYLCCRRWYSRKYSFWSMYSVK